jgi:hypothetical protein
MATESNTAELSIDEEIEQIANEIANEIEEEIMAEASTEAPDKPGAGGTGSAPESGKVTKVAPPKGKKLTKKKVKAGAETKGEGDDPSEIEVYEAADEDEEENGNGKKKKKGKNPFAKKNGDEDDEDEDVEEQVIPETKQEIIRAVFETMKDTDADTLAGAYSKLMKDLLDESASDDDEDEEAYEETTSMERMVVTSEDINIADDLTAIFGDHADDLSEGFKAQVQTVFEAAVVAKINSELEKIENTFASKLTESKDEILSTLTDKVDNYLSYVVEEWVKENEIAIDRGVKAEITEEFIGGLKQLFEDHYIDIPEEKVDVVDSLADRVDQLETELNETIETNISLASRVKSFQKNEVLGEISNNLTDIEAEKLKDLSQGVGFENVDQYRMSLETIRENYFPGTGSATGVSVSRVIDEEYDITEEDTSSNRVIDSQMAAYVNTLGRTVVENQ